MGDLHTDRRENETGTHGIVFSGNRFRYTSFKDVLIEYISRYEFWDEDIFIKEVGLEGKITKEQIKGFLVGELIPDVNLSRHLSEIISKELKIQKLNLMFRINDEREGFPEKNVVEIEGSVKINEEFRPLYTYSRVSSGGAMESEYFKLLTDSIRSKISSESNNRSVDVKYSDHELISILANELGVNRFVIYGFHPKPNFVSSDDMASVIAGMLDDGDPGLNQRLFDLGRDFFEKSKAIDIVTPYEKGIDITLGEALKIARKNKCSNRKKFCESVGINEATLDDWELNKRNPKKKNLNFLMSNFDLSDDHHDLFNVMYKKVKGLSLLPEKDQGYEDLIRTFFDSRGNSFKDMGIKKGGTSLYSIGSYRFGSSGDGIYFKVIKRTIDFLQLNKEEVALLKEKFLDYFEPFYKGEYGDDAREYLLQKFCKKVLGESFFVKKKEHDIPEEKENYLGLIKRYLGQKGYTITDIGEVFGGGGGLHLDVHSRTPLLTRIITYVDLDERQTALVKEKWLDHFCSQKDGAVMGGYAEKALIKKRERFSRKFDEYLSIHSGKSGVNIEYCMWDGR